MPHQHILQFGFAIETDSGFRGYNVIVTMGMPGWLYKWYLGFHAVRSLRRNILNFVGIAPVRTRILGGVKAVSQAERARWTREVEALGAAAR